MTAATTNLTEQAVLTEQRVQLRGITQAVEGIAEQFSLPLSDVHEIARIHIHRLEQQARIKQYISILVIKQVKDSLRTTRGKPAA